MLDGKQSTTPLVKKQKEQKHSSTRNGLVFLSISQLMAMGMCAFVLGALIPIVIHFHNHRNDDSATTLTAARSSTTNDRDTRTPITHQELFNNLRPNSSKSNNNNNNNNRGPKIAWLMSFPNSGTSFTMDLVAAASNMTMATNYGDEIVKQQGNNSSSSSSSRPIQDPIPVIPKTQGPFWLMPLKRHPTHAVLTKTHCGAFCHDCKALGSVETPHSFMFHCAMAQQVVVVPSDQDKDKNTTTTTVLREWQRHVYDYNQVDRAVHLFRDPLDNLVSRYHFAVQEMVLPNRNYTRNAAGLQQYCGDILDTHDEHHDSRVDQRALQLIQDIPCHYDLFRYIHWHNMAFITTKDNLNLPTHIVYYEDYETDMEATLQPLLHFLELPDTGIRAPFHSGKAYREYFSVDQIQRLRNASRILASPQTWQSMKRYFEN